MNLQQVLNYHNNCIICQAEMEIKSPDLAGVRLTVTEDGLEVKTGHKDINVFFNYDGTYHKMKRWNALYAKPLQVLKECPSCVPEIEVDGKKVRIQYKPRSVGATTLLQSKDLHFAYTFSLFGDDDGYFDANLDWEDVKFYNKHNFYHINTKFSEKRTWLLHGVNEKDGEANVNSISFPAIFTTNVNDISQLLNKLKLYNVFS